MVRGFDVNEETLALDVIRAVGPGGHYLVSEHTRKHFREELWLPRLADRRPWDVWQADGGKDVTVRARERVEALLAAHRPIPPAPERAAAVDAVVRDICRREGVDYDTVAV